MINISKVTKSFDELFRPVLNCIDLKLREGEFCIIIGANGSGKSTLFKLITGECYATSGQIELRGKVAQVIQDVNLGTIPEMSLFENIALSEIKVPRLLFYKRFKEQVLKKLKNLDIGLQEYIDYPLKKLSGGQRQMIATLMAIHSGCKILLLDEHTSALDPKTQRLLMEYTCTQIKKQGLTTLMITHKMDEAIKYGNRLIMLHQGKIVLDIQGEKKHFLKIQDLVDIFHQYEDQILFSRAKNDP